MTDPDPARPRGDSEDPATPDIEASLGVIEEWFRRTEAGESVDIEELCAGHPDLLPTILDILESDDAISRSLATLSSADHPAVGLPFARVGPYRLLSQIGSGAMGRVFRAEDERLGRQVAVKLLHDHVFSDPKKRLRFEREARVTAALEHPNIVPVFDVGTAHGVGFMAMRLIDGPSLAELQKPLPPRDVAALGAALARAIHEAHQLGVIHRDIKPANILIDTTDRGERTPVLLDFGLARNVMDVSATAEGTVTGTLLYMSPEQVRGETITIDGRTDVYSLGATLYECLSGEPPHPASTAAQVTQDILTRDPPSLPLRGIDRDLETVVLRALEKERTRRFFSAQTMAEDLERYLAGEAIASRRIGPVGRLLRKARRHRRTTAAVSMVALVASLLGVQLMVQSARASRDFDRRAVSVAEDIHALNLDTAGERLTELERLRAGDSGLIALRRRWHAARALEQFLDILPTRSIYEARQRLSALRDELLANGGDQLRRPISDLALIAAALRLGDRDEARRRLARVVADFGESRAAVAMSAVAEGESPVRAVASLADATPADAGSDLADQHFFTAMAIDIAGDPIADEATEIELALRRSPTHYRARLYRAQLLYREGDWVAALEALRGIIREGRHPPVVIRHMAEAAMAIGDLESAEMQLARISAGDFDAHCYMTRNELLLLQGRIAEASAYAEEAMERFQGEPMVYLSAVQAALAAKNLESVSELLDKASTLALTEVQRLYVGFFRAAHELEVGFNHRDASSFPALAARIRELEAASRDPHLTAVLTQLRGRVHGFLGQYEEATEACLESLRLVRTDHRTLYCLALALPKSPDPEPEVLEESIQLFSDALNDVMRPLPPPYRDRFLAAYTDAIRRQGRFSALELAVERMRREISGSPESLQLLQESESALSASHRQEE